MNVSADRSTRTSAPRLQPAPAETQPAETPTVDEPAEPAESSGQKNARQAAEDYLAYQAFSRKSLIEQLKYEGYSKAEAEYAVDAIKGLLGEVPVFGICLGHQLLSLAIGAHTEKLPFGHHGGNHPVRRLSTGAVEITSQNHNFAVVADSLAGRAEMTHVNLNDGVCEGLRVLDAPAFSVQHHPEAGPGPHDSSYLFDSFVELMHAS